MSETKPLSEGLQESLTWYLTHPESVRKKPYMDYIDNHPADVFSPTSPA